MFKFESDFLTKAQADWLFKYLKTLTYNNIIYKNNVKMPRQTLWFAENEITYTYSGVKNTAIAFTEPLERLKALAIARTGQSFNSLLINRYRDGNDSIGLHADDEKELGENPYILSLSVGATRKFTVIENATKHLTDYHLTHGSAIHMFGESQKRTKHMVGKQRNVGERFNLTFRRIY